MRHPRPLGSGQKVVVFTQYLGMIELMRRHLEGAGVGHAILTGATTDCGGVVDRFNREPGCHVFLGSLKAGSGGQKRAVQVFKLVTEGTVEEKIFTRDELLEMLRGE